MLLLGPEKKPKKPSVTSLLILIERVKRRKTEKKRKIRVSLYPTRTQKDALTLPFMAIVVRGLGFVMVT